MGMSLGTSGGGRGRGRKAYRPMAEINVTPLVDVMLVLLIVFMVSAPLLTAGVPVDLPSSQAKALTQEDEKPLEISLRGDGEIYVGETLVKKERLIPMLSAITESNPDRRIYVRGDQKLAYGEIMETIGAINAAGFRKVALITDPQHRK
ncbi:MAG: protein TolR [Rhodospirillales bacterium]|nr:protein TolR [Rhodospirillales bacterium]MCB9964563.1 protein TolR [Rhodospirillales bacterium]MCB9973917.1 protein TolR [Rhodospirillales bacterium]